MAPKRTSGAKTTTAKRAKTAAPEAPLLDFVGKCDEIPKPCREMLQAALPICLEVVEADRHKFQAEVLVKVAALLASVESKKREAVAAAEAELATMESEKGTAAADEEAKKGASAGQQSQCDEKSKSVDAAREASNAAKAVLKEAQSAEEAFNKKQGELTSEQESFGKLMSEVFHPLKAGTLGGVWQKRNKSITEMQKKLKHLGAQESLGDALAATLKMTPEKRQGTFAKATMEFAEEYFNKHTAKVAADIAGLATEAEGHQRAIANAQAALNDLNGALEVVEKEWDGMQDVWIGLENEAAKATKASSEILRKIPKVQKSIDKANADLEKFLELPALFAKLKEHSTKAPEEEEEPEEAAEEEKAAEDGEGEADESMQA